MSYPRAVHRPIVVALMLATSSCASPPDPAPAPGPSGGAPAPSQAEHELTVEASCRDSMPCEWRGGDLHLLIRIPNRGSTPLALPLAYLRATGPSIRLVDGRTGADLQLRTNPGAGELRGQWTSIAPGEEATLQWILHEHELAHFGAQVELVAEIVVFGQMQAGARTIPFEGRASLPIRGGAQPGR
jgi:hypothetical protein